jgi:Zn-dependent peptidase ImmA (M78 family)
MIIPDTSIHISGQLITPDLDKFIKEKIKMFRKKHLNDAPLEEVIGILSGYNTKIIDGNVCSGYCDSRNRIIGLDSSQTILEQRTIVFHELGHTFQYELELIKHDDLLLSKRVEIEWQAESVAYRMFNELYGFLHHSRFSSYFSKDSILWLDKYYKKCSGMIENDILNL